MKKMRFVMLSLSLLTLAASAKADDTVYLDTDGFPYVLLPDGRTRVPPMPKIDGCDIGLKWAPVAQIYWCPTYMDNPDPPVVVVTTTPPSTPPTGPSADEQAYQQWLYDWNNYQAALALQAQQEAAAAAAAAVPFTPVPVVIPPPGPTIWYCNHNAWAYYTVSPDEGGNCSNH